MDALPLTSMAALLAGGLAFFLFGLELMTGGLKALAGGGLKAALARMTSNRFRAVLAGAFATAALQSSSITTVLIVGFVSAGLITLPQSIGMIMGANIGSTLTAQIIAFKITAFALPLAAFGFFARLLARRDWHRMAGDVVLGLGLLFVGLDFMGQATTPLRGFPAFLDAMRDMTHPLLGVAFGALFTAMIQSSAATTGIVIVLGGQGLIPLESAIALILGANIGTCATALLASIGKPVDARRVALAHVLFNLIGVAIALPLMPLLAQAVRALGTDLPRQIANAHTLFNVGTTLLLVAFTDPLARLCTRLVPSPTDGTLDPGLPRHLDPAALAVPSVALDQLRLETLRLGRLVLDYIESAPPVLLQGETLALDRLAADDDPIDRLHAAILAFHGRLGQTALTDAESTQQRALLAAATYLENAADTVSVNLTTLARERLHHRAPVANLTGPAVQAVFTTATTSLRLALEAIEHHDPLRAGEVLAFKKTIHAQCDAARRELLSRIHPDNEAEILAYRLLSDGLEHLKQIAYFSRRLARLAISTPWNENDK
jgi:phosphate:Na+ symporter